MVDPAKFDFYAMDCYRHIGEDRLASGLAEEVIRQSVDFDGRQRPPMRVAEANITLGVVAAREGDLDEAIALGRRALNGDRKSLPSLAMVSQDLEHVLHGQYEGEPEARDYLNDLRKIRQTPSIA
ncbi:tetratricopeptide repeat protein [Actinocrispum sp. NPDC049592]|uniref:tetratricopeptide repeat protein n=1 Tax=Actinocrispum sp. NPDC049592 TaxID=3154835 RepID=UPI00341E4CCB